MFETNRHPILNVFFVCVFTFQPRLVQAVFQGNYEEVENLLTKSMAANMSDAEKRTPLHAAAFRGLAEIAGKPMFLETLR
jgi:hypothetical protein